MARRHLLDRLSGLGATIGEDARAQVRREMLVLGAAMYGGLAIIWGSLYLALGLTRAALIPYSYVIVAVVLFGILSLTGRISVVRTTILVAWLILPLVLQFILGGFVAASAVVLWSIGAPIGALFFHPRASHWWAMGFVVVLAVAGIADPTLQPAAGLTPETIRLFLVLNLAGVGIALFLISRDFLDRLQRARAELQREKERSEELLLNVLPEPIAQRLKDGEMVIADRYDEISIVIADLVGFTSMSEELPADRVVDMLDNLVADFDRLVDKHGMEKIRTMGDAYMAVAGAPESRDDHREAAAMLALEMLETAHRHNDPNGKHLEVRIGIDSGPVVAGVIGLHKFVYDVWGDPVNTASRMESLGVPGRIQVTDRVYQRICDKFRFDERGLIDVKGKGPMPTYLLVGEADEGSEG